MPGAAAEPLAGPPVSVLDRKGSVAVVLVGAAHAPGPSRLATTKARVEDARLTAPSHAGDVPSGGPQKPRLPRRSRHARAPRRFFRADGWRAFGPDDRGYHPHGRPSVQVV